LETGEIQSKPSTGRIVGFSFDKEGNIIGGDSVIGLVSVSRNGDRTILTNRVNDDNTLITYADVRKYFIKFKGCNDFKRWRYLFYRCFCSQTSMGWTKMGRISIFQSRHCITNSNWKSVEIFTKNKENYTYCSRDSICKRNNTFKK
jgi:hypothetical protein